MSARNKAREVLSRASVALKERNAARLGLPLTLTPLALVEAILGPCVVTLVPAGHLPGYGSVSRVRDRWSIYIAEDAPQPIQQFVMLHELAHTELGKDASEAECDALASELLAACWGRRSTRWREAVALYGERFERRGSKRYAEEMAIAHAAGGASTATRA